MYPVQLDNNYIKKLEERVKYLEEVHRSTLDILDMMVTLGGNLSRSLLLLNPIQIFKETETHLKRLYPFDTIIFLEVNEKNFDFIMAYCDHEANSTLFQKEIDINVTEGNFAWALRQNRAVAIPSNFFDGKNLIFHSLKTKSRVVGMFLGVLSRNEFNVGDISSDLLSIILNNCAQALENSALYTQLKTANKRLTLEINERILSEECRLKLEHELMQQSRLSSIGLLTAGIAHNLRGPLAALMGYTTLIQIGNFESDDIDKMIQMTKNMENIIETMLQKSRRSQETQKSPLYLNELLSTELSFLEADSYYKHQVDKEFHFQEDLPQIQGVYSNFSQGLMNLIHNGLHAMVQSEQKKLTVKTMTVEDSIHITISDTGYGISKENIPKLFSPFFSTKLKSGSGDSKEPTGTGLGLYSSYQLLQPYGVQFHVESVIGKGTTFTVQVPLNG